MKRPYAQLDNHMDPIFDDISIAALIKVKQMDMFHHPENNGDSDFEIHVECVGLHWEGISLSLYASGDHVEISAMAEQFVPGSVHKVRGDYVVHSDGISIYNPQLLELSLEEIAFLEESFDL